MSKTKKTNALDSTWSGRFLTVWSSHVFVGVLILLIQAEVGFGSGLSSLSKAERWEHFDKDLLGIDFGSVSGEAYSQYRFAKDHVTLQRQSAGFTRINAGTKLGNYLYGAMTFGTQTEVATTSSTNNFIALPFELTAHRTFASAELYFKAVSYRLGILLNWSLTEFAREYSDFSSSDAIERRDPQFVIGRQLADFYWYLSYQPSVRVVERNGQIIKGPTYQLNIGDRRPQGYSLQLAYEDPSRLLRGTKAYLRSTFFYSLLLRDTLVWQAGMSYRESIFASRDDASYLRLPEFSLSTGLDWFLYKNLRIASLLSWRQSRGIDTEYFNRSAKHRSGLFEAQGQLTMFF